MMRASSMEDVLSCVANEGVAAAAATAAGVLGSGLVIGCTALTGVVAATECC